jgi:hypothetical protein
MMVGKRGQMARWLLTPLRLLTRKSSTRMMRQSRQPIPTQMELYRPMRKMTRQWGSMTRKMRLMTTLLHLPRMTERCLSEKMRLLLRLPPMKMKRQMRTRLRRLQRMAMALTLPLPLMRMKRLMFRKCRSYWT